MLELDIISRRYGKLPSEICDRDIGDYNLDLVIASQALKEEQRQTSKARAKVGKKVAYRRK